MRANHPAARPGANLLANPGAQAGAASARGWDSVTIPGWQVASGLPTVVRYGTTHFPAATGKSPARPGGQLFAGGAGGTARLRQAVPLRSPARARARRHALPALRVARRHGPEPGRGDGGVRVRVRPACSRGTSSARPARVRPATGLVPRAATGTLPRGTASARVTLVLATSLTNIDGPDAPYVGYDRAVADDLRFTVAAPGPPARAAHPARLARSPLPARVPVLLRERGLRLRRRQHPAGPLPEQPAAQGQPAQPVLRRGAPERRQLPRPGRREHLRRPARRPAGGEPAVHHPTPATSATSSAPRTRPGRPTCKARTARATTRCTATTGTTTSR